MAEKKIRSIFADACIKDKRRKARDVVCHECKIPRFVQNKKVPHPQATSTFSDISVRSENVGNLSDNDG